jgi:hypothetical protein
MVHVESRWWKSVLFATRERTERGGSSATWLVYLRGKGEA